MPCDAVLLDLGTILQIAESLESVVCRCFGPDGGQVLFIKATGELLITRDGKTILESLLLDHPVARMIVGCALKHCSATGDGTKSFIVLLCEALRGLKSLIHKNEGELVCGPKIKGTKHRNHSHMLKKICHSLLRFQIDVLEKIIGRQLGKHFLSVFHPPNQKAEVYKDALTSTLGAYFSGKIGKINQKFITEMATDFFIKCVARGYDMEDVVGVVDEFFFELHTPAYGLPVAKSRVLPGLVLHRDFAVFCQVEGDLRGLIVTEPVHSGLATTGFDIAVNSEAQFLRFQVEATKRTEGFMKHLQNNGINLILSSVKQSETALYCCRLYGISLVDCLSAEEISLLCRVTGISPEYKPSWERSQGTFTETLIATFCRPIILGSHRYVHLGVVSTGAFEPHCVVLCGPVKGLTEQHISAFHGACKMVRQLLKELDAICNQDSDEEKETSGQCFRHEDVFSNCGMQLERNDKQKDRQYIAYSTGRVVDHVENETNLQNRSREKATLHVESESKEILPNALHTVSTNNSASKPHTEFQAEQSMQGENSEEENNTLHITQQLSAKGACRESTQHQANCLQSEACSSGCYRYRESFIPAGSVMPVGGTFEILLHYYLNQYAAQSKHSELAQVTTLVANTLLGIPRNLHKIPKGNTQFLQAYTAAINAVRSSKPVLVNQKGLESVSCKYQLLASVFHCITSLVTIDSVIGIKKEPQNIDDSESEI
ncbi:hypothetical protein NDU88_002590 [Pleurodeles waltl]|uniref:Bardet-Biedl syndrome 10 protein n=1 Tax=Pleurodeles waltl TaxID=8319 RepID=A0AAV7SDP4_PLEWA|nr:hypothetical protein NDU88_002590 [Pleurodeles waltl]